VNRLKDILKSERTQDHKDKLSEEEPTRNVMGRDTTQIREGVQLSLN